MHVLGATAAIGLRLKTEPSPRANFSHSDGVESDLGLERRVVRTGRPSALFDLSGTSDPPRQTSNRFWDIARTVPYPLFAVDQERAVRSSCLSAMKGKTYPFRILSGPLRE